MTIFILLFLAAAPRYTCKTCPPEILNSVDQHRSVPLGQGGDPAKPCHFRIKDGYPLPDPACTPGAINPAVTPSVLSRSTFQTGCLRNCATSEAQKTKVYSRYRIGRPARKRGAGAACELDHLIPLELGGADTLDNIWPQCGPRLFREKDLVENYLAARVKERAMPLLDAQRGIAADWTRYLVEARSFCASRREGCKGRY